MEHIASPRSLNIFFNNYFHKLQASSIILCTSRIATAAPWPFKWCHFSRLLKQTGLKKKISERKNMLPWRLINYANGFTACYTMDYAFIFHINVLYVFQLVMANYLSFTLARAAQWASVEYFPSSVGWIPAQILLEALICNFLNEWMCSIWHHLIHVGNYLLTKELEKVVFPFLQWWLAKK